VTALAHRLAFTLLAGLLALAAGESGAVTCSGSTTSVNFGAYNVFSASNDDSTGTVVVTCSKDAGDPSGGVTVNYEVELGPGNSGNILARQMTSGANTLNYNLYTNTARTTVWGNGVTGSSVTASFNLSNATPSRSRTHNVFGRIPPLQDVSVSVLYQDNVLVSIQF
jgi:spore coat protein U-like protein